MYNGRDFSELSMISIKEWQDNELDYFHHCMQQITPYLNSEGVSIRNEIVQEIGERNHLKN